MIAVDTSSLRRFLENATGPDVEAVAASLENSQMVLPPAVLTELLSDPALDRRVVEVLSAIPMLPVLDGYWFRAGLLRAALIARGVKAKVADSLIAQSCVDHSVPLITHDRDFRHFVREGLVLA